MAEVAVVSVEVSEKGIDTLYPPSWFDRLKVWVERLPGPAWLFYLGGAVALYALRTVLQWLDGSSPTGAFGTSLIFTSAWPWYGLAVMHYLDSAAGRALDTLRPIFSGTDEACGEFRYRLTTMPARPALAAGLGALLFGLLVFLVSTFDANVLAELESHVAITFGFGTSLVVLILSLVAVWIVMGLFFYHTIRQMRLVRSITTQHTTVDIFQLPPLYAFSRVTAATAVAWSGGLTIGVLTILTIPQVLADPFAVAMALGSILLAVVTFAWPLLGIHSVLEAEKTRLHLDARERMKEAMIELKRRQDRADYDSVGAMNNALDALLKHQADLDKISTWPWRTGTVGALATAIFLPLLLWFLTRILSQLFGE
ncbi:MAG: hypothetical protein ABI670_01915 [Chloroflexota bacterium]